MPQTGRLHDTRPPCRSLRSAALRSARMSSPDRAPPSAAPRLEIVRAEEFHAPMIAEFFRHVWDPLATPDAVLTARRLAAAQNVAEPGVAPPTWIALQSGRCLGYVTTIPVQLEDGRRQWPAYLIKGLMVLPEFRGGPVGYLVLKAAVASLPRTAALAVAPPARRLFEALGYSDLGAVPNWIRPLSPHRILERMSPADLGLTDMPRGVASALKVARATGLGSLLGRIGGATLRAAAAVHRLSTRHLEIGSLDPINSAHDVELLWQSVRGAYHGAVVRDSRYMLHRYGSPPGSPYQWLAARDRGRLAGIAILRRPRDSGDERLRGIRIATLAEVIYHPGTPTIALALLGAAEAAARDADADAVLASTSSPLLGAVLRRQYFLPRAGNVHFLFRDATSDATELGRSLTDWWISRGDGQADETF